MHGAGPPSCPSRRVRVTTRRVRLLLLGSAPDLAHGRYPAPAWLILLATGVVVAFIVVLLVMRFRRSDKDDR
jgi:hypothetical protein